MNKMLLMLPCITAYFFVCSMGSEQLPSPRQSSPRSIPIPRADSSPFRDRKLSHPIERVKALKSSESNSTKDAELDRTGVEKLVKRRKSVEPK